MWSVLAVVLLSALGIQVKGTDQVCYEYVGCFDNSPPFEKTVHGYLPKSPKELDVKLKLYTPKNADTPYYLNYSDATSVTHSNFDAKLPLKIIIHGFLSKAKGNWVTAMKNEILKKEKANVVEVDWSKGADMVDYNQAVANVRLVAIQLKMLIDHFVNETQMPLENVHIIGHSLGAHMAGYIGYLLDSKIGRISALDAAELGYQGVPLPARVDYTDAIFVDAIHTDGGPMSGLGLNGGLGIWEAYGHVDFYVNGGKKQPGCKSPLEKLLDVFGKRGLADVFACNHVRSHYIFTDSINSPCPYTTFPCDSYGGFKSGECATCGERGCGSVGYYANIASGRGKQYLKTLAQKPYCGYQYKVVADLESTQGLNNSGGALHISFGSSDASLTSEGIIKASDAKIDESSYQGVIIVEKHVDPIVAVVAHFKTKKDSKTSVSFDIQNIELTFMNTGHTLSTVPGSYSATGRYGATIPMDTEDTSNTVIG